MTYEPWPTVTVGGKDYWEVDIKARVAKESDPNAQVLILVGTPNGGAAAVGPLVQGDPGKHAEIDTTIDFTALEPDDPTSDSASWTTVTPPDDTTPGVYQLSLALHKGAKGDDGATVLDPATFSATVAAQILQVNSDLSAFELADQRVAQVYRPATINNTPAGNANYTLATVPVSSKTFNRIIIPFGYVIVKGNTGPDVVVDFIARITTETSGNIIGRFPGVGGAVDRLSLVPATPTGTSDYEKVAAGVSTNVYFRVERQSGSDDYTTSNTTTRCGVLALPIA